MLHEQSDKDRKQFRSFVLHLKKLHPSWKPKDIAKFLLRSENPPSYTTTNALRLKIWRILKRNQVDDLSRSGAPPTTTTIEYIEAVKQAIQLKKMHLLGSGTFTLTPQYNQHNEDVMLWGGISYRGLFPKHSPIFVDDWLESIRSEGDDCRKKMYFTSERYAKFIRTIVA
ncbi:unnamed protein product [Rotaria sordida]|uniref:Uncharacterized protein n=1 Tax=Rotaria sordida TaxID=392033 RepID=A0A819T9D9_9BILA|nr:unnamed protein product [Rotaria sordida]CAF4075241.1 unnamed protein product [Rotaria sordida]CAF4095274.1 unnamed protein product [Rotaria sordida]